LLREGWSELVPGVDAFFRKGGAQGPLALVIAGIHGDEYEGPAAVAAFVERLGGMPAVRGDILAIPVANPMAWRAAQRTSPEDGLNLARAFPGRADGTATERLAASLFEVGSRADYVIDLHSGGVEYLFHPLCGFYGDPREDNASFAAARRFGLRVLWQLPPTAGVLSHELWQRGRCVVGCEYRGAGQLAPSGRETYTRGILSTLGHWKLIDEEFVLAAEGRACAGEWQMSKAEGLFVASCGIGDAVAPGQLLAEIRDLRGSVRQSFHAGAEGGFVLAIRSKAWIRQDNWGVFVARNL
jgi:N-alpha-acetyl-L-2,4-diaminobutyrate deacetylase